ncbi:hypothetical protein [Sphingomonas sp.]|uniref:hypothetical protein n=1 Tax=Sphingomonas sp. TaxID=28214 RepID=UPI0017D25432|nr:hypothetical protein [Sphingomonas sp.]MBA3510972.1 hypothetical protein [Sphingomonas sp.]
MAALTMLCACQPEAQDPGNLHNAEEPTLNASVVPRPQPALDRAAIFAAVARAASAEAAGTDHSEAQRELDGRQFEIRIRFGCKGPSTELREEWLGWSFDREKGTLRVRAMPTLSAEEQLVKALGGDQFEAVEGFWIPRPWLLEAACPATAAVSSAPAEPAADAASKETGAQPATTPAAAAESQQITEPVPKWPRIGIAQFFTETDPRTGRRSMRPYEAVKTLGPEQPIGSQGFNLVLSGRLKALPDKRVIACVAKGADSPPECIVSVDFDRVWIEKPADREILAEWGGG